MSVASLEMLIFLLSHCSEATVFCCVF